MTLLWTILGLLPYAAIGCVEWFLALLRTRCFVRGQRRRTAVLILVEQVVSFAVVFAAVDDKNWAIVLAYALGGAGGSLLVGGKKKEKA